MRSPVHRPVNAVNPIVKSDKLKHVHKPRPKVKRTKFQFYPFSCHIKSWCSQNPVYVFSLFNKWWNNLIYCQFTWNENYRLWFLFSVCINIVHPGLKKKARFSDSVRHIHYQKLFETKWEYPTGRALTCDWSVNLFVMVLCEKVWPEFSVLNMTVRTECSSYSLLCNVDNVIVKYQTVQSFINADRV